MTTANIRRRQGIRLLAISVLMAVLALAGSAPVAADGVNQASDVSVAASLDGNELTFVIRQPPTVPGQLRIDVIAHTPVRAATLRLAPVPLVGAPAAADDHAALTLVSGQGGTSSVLLSVDRKGPWELRVGAGAGADTARFPFRVLTARAASWEKVAYPALLSSGVFLLAVFGAAAAGRRRWIWPAAVAALVAGTVGFTTALLSPNMPAVTAAGATTEKLLTNGDGTIANGRPFAQAALTTTPAEPVAGTEFALHIGLTDGATGAPVDDLTVHHGALAHTVVTSSDLRYFAHLHPVSVAPGDLLLRLNLPQPGRYLVQTEIQRTDSGDQVLTAELTVGGPPSQSPGSTALDTVQDSRVALDPSPPSQSPDSTTPDTVQDSRVALDPSPPSQSPDSTAPDTAQDSRVALDPSRPGQGTDPAVPDTAQDSQVAPDTAQDSQVTLDPSPPVAGVPTTLTLHAGTDTAPFSDLQGWLGMAGHMIVRRPGDDYFGHVHETASMAAAAVPGAVVPDETVGRYGPLLHFVFVFPAPGRYQLWIQYERDFRIHTAALTVDVAGGSP